jgi:phosphate transport system substrate-binding protein
MTHVGRRVRAGITAVVAILAVGLGVLATTGPAGATTYASVSGQGSTYAAIAFQTWTESVQRQGLSVNYTSTGSPAGLSAYQQNTADFAGTEAEFSELYPTSNGTANAHVPRGFAYTPDVAGATAIMYHVAVNATGSDPVTYLHLSRLTVAKIFLGLITNWDSPTITADNKGLVLPNKPITVVYRSGQSGTTALFYDFVKQTDPTAFHAWAVKCGFNPSVRVWEIDDCSTGNGFAQTEKETGSDQQAQYVSGATGLWSISYDEFGYAKVYNDNVAWIGNASGNWVQPYALNIAAALKSAVLAPDTSQTLDAVYSSATPSAYPISAYSYILYQCAPTGTRPTCKTPYSNPGIINTMAKFMRYIACTGQVSMATLGYSPLPTQLSQFMANAIGYMSGQPAEQLTGADCANPQFQGGSLGVGATPPPDPTAGVSSLASGTGGGKAPSGTKAATSSSGGPAAAATPSSGGGSSVDDTPAAAGVTTTTTAGAASAAGLSGSGTKAVGGGSSNWLPSSPVAYVGPNPGSSPPWPWLTLLFLLLVPVALLTISGRRRRKARLADGAVAGLSAGTAAASEAQEEAGQP